LLKPSLARTQNGRKEESHTPDRQDSQCWLEDERDGQPVAGAARTFKNSDEKNACDGADQSEEDQRQKLERIYECKLRRRKHGARALKAAVDRISRESSHLGRHQGLGIEVFQVNDFDREEGSTQRLTENAAYAGRNDCHQHNSPLAIAQMQLLGNEGRQCGANLSDGAFAARASA